jgi:iron(III) transport system permease protein
MAETADDRMILRPALLESLRLPVSSRALAVAGLVLVLAILVLPPLLFLLKASVTATGPGRASQLTLSHFTGILSEPRFAVSALNSAIFAVGSALTALLIGGANAWIAERTDAPFRPLAYLTTIVSLGTPYVLYTSAWLLLLNRSGPVNSIWRGLTDSTGVLVDVYSMAGMTVIEGLLWSPIAFLLLAATFHSSNLDYEDAARMCGAGPGSMLRRVTLPLALPSVLALALLVFVRALEAFEVPALVGKPGRVDVLTIDIYEAMRATVPPDLGYASAASVILLLVVAVLLAFYARLVRNAERYATITGKGYKPRPLALGPWRPLAGAVLILNFTLLILLPAAILAWASLLPFYQFRWSTLALVSLKNYASVLSNARYIDLVINTFVVAMFSATFAMAITALSAWLTVRKAPGSFALDQLASVPLVFPGIVLGVGVMQFWLQLPPIGVYGTVNILIWAFVINYLPYGMRYSVAGMLQIHRELEEAGAIAGAGPYVLVRRVVLPLLLPSLIAGWLFIFLLACRALSVPILLAGPSSQTMAVAMFDLWSNGQGPELAALGLLWSLVTTAIAVMFYIVAQRAGGGMYGQR